MKITLDKSVDAVYIYLVNPSLVTPDGNTYTCNPKEIDGMINLDFDMDKVLVGIEVLDASKKFVTEFMDRLEEKLNDINININYDKDVDAAYIYFSKFPATKVDYTYPCNPKEVNGMINLDFSEGKFVGIEVMDASKKLPIELLNVNRVIYEKQS